MYQLIGEQHFATGASAPAAARSFVASKLGSLAAPDVANVLLATSELATNAVKHTDGDFDVRLLSEEQTVRIEVADSSSEPPVLQPHSLERAGGRGVVIIQGVCTAWGVAEQPPGDGKVVWCSIPTGSSWL